MSLPKRPKLQVFAVMAAIGLAAGGGAVGPAMAAFDPAVEANLPVWQNPDGRSTDPEQQVSIDIKDVQPRIVAAGEAKVSYTLRVSNQRDTPVDNVSLQLQSLPAAGTAAEVRRAALSNSGEYTEITEAVELPALGPRESAEVSVTVALDPQQVSGSGVMFAAPHLQAPGPHPIMFSLFGDTLQGQTGLISVARSTLTVGTTEQEHAAPLTFMWPISAETDVAPGGTGDAPERAPLILRSEKLAQELSDGGRLRGLLDAYREAMAGPQQQALRGSSCLALDPELVDTVQRMSHGYRVGEQNTLEESQPRRLRDSWGEIFGTADDKTVEGIGSAAAQRWLEDLRETAQGGCSVVLPFAGADVNTLANSGVSELTEMATQQGRGIIRETLGVEPLENVTIPTSGYIAANATTAYAGQTALVVDNSISLSQEAELEEEASEDPEAAARAQQQANRSVEVPAGGGTMTALRFNGDLATSLRATGTRPEVAGFSNPNTRYDVTQDSATARMGDALGVLDREVASGDPVLAVPPSDWSVNKADATAFLQAMGTLIHNKRAQPTSLHDSLVARNTVRPARGISTRPFDDPAATAPEFAERVGHAAKDVQALRALMIQDNRLALTPKIYTQPLLQDLLRATAGERATNKNAWARVRAEMTYRVDTVSQTAQALRNTITLVPPGNVFTRSSDNSPLLVVARNGLPLPVPVDVSYTTVPEGFRLEVPERQIIPAEGSITLSLYPINDNTETARSERTNVKLWLNSPHGEQISEAVELAVQKAPGMGIKELLIVIALLLGLGVGAKTLWSRRVAGKRRSEPRNT